MQLSRTLQSPSRNNHPNPAVSFKNQQIQFLIQQLLKPPICISKLMWIQKRLNQKEQERIRTEHPDKVWHCNPLIAQWRGINLSSDQSPGCLLRTRVGVCEYLPEAAQPIGFPSIPSLVHTFNKLEKGNPEQKIGTWLWRDIFLKNPTSVKF